MSLGRRLRRLIPRTITDVALAARDLNGSLEAIRERARSVAYGLRSACQKRPLTLDEIEMFVDAGCQDLANDIRAGAERDGIPEQATLPIIILAQSEFEKAFKPLALEIVPIVRPEDCISNMSPEGHA